MPGIKGLAYYLSSLLTLLRGIRNPGIVLRLLLGRRTAVVRLRDGSQFKIRSLMDLWILKETCLDKNYERAIPTPGEDWTIIDIGAGVGDFCICAAWCHPRRTIAAFKPFPESYRLLQENLRLNRIGNVRAFECAVSARSGPMLLQTATGLAGQHRTVVESDPKRPALSIEAVTLEDAFRKAGIARCDLLKVDCEGGEFDIFFSAPPEMLRRIERIAMEYHDGFTPHFHTELAAFFEQNGFSVELRVNPVHRNLGFLTALRKPIKSSL
jgi:FkbM family methyltransferase